MPQSALTLWAVRSRLVLSRSIGFAVCEKAGSDRAANSRKVLFSMAARLVRRGKKFKMNVARGQDGYRRERRKCNLATLSLLSFRKRAARRNLLILALSALSRAIETGNRKRLIVS